MADLVGQVSNWRHHLQAYQSECLSYVTPTHGVRSDSEWHPLTPTQQKLHVMYSMSAIEALPVRMKITIVT